MNQLCIIIAILILIFILLWCQTKSTMKNNLCSKYKIAFHGANKDIITDTCMYLLNRYYKDYISIVGISDNPDTIIYSVFKKKLPKSKAHKVLIWLEPTKIYSFNIKRKESYADAIISTPYLNTNKNFIRFPYWVAQSLISLPKDHLLKMIYDRATFNLKTKTKFCSYINSRCHKHRNNFVKELMKYKKVHCGGKCLNNYKLNDGYKDTKNRFESKMKILKDYKFTIAMENSSEPGYTTEKIWEPLLCNSLPIYWGDPFVNDDFHPSTFINIQDFKSTKECIDFIKLVDNNDELYMSYFMRPLVYSDKWIEVFTDPEEKYFKKIAALFTNS